MSKGSRFQKFTGIIAYSHRYDSGVTGYHIYTSPHETILRNQDPTSRYSEMEKILEKMEETVKRLHPDAQILVRDWVWEN